MWGHRAQQRNIPVKREAAVAGLASEGLVLFSGSVGAGSSTLFASLASEGLVLFLGSAGAGSSAVVESRSLLFLI